MAPCDNIVEERVAAHAWRQSDQAKTPQWKGKFGAREKPSDDWSKLLLSPPPTKKGSLASGHSNTAAKVRNPAMSRGCTGWPKAGQGAGLGLDPHQLHLLLWNGDPSRAHTAPLWRRVE